MFLYHAWCELNINTRHRIAQDFNIAKKLPTEVFNNTIKSDGYVVKDIEQALNIDALQKYIGTSETDMALLWTWLVDKAEGRELTNVNIDTTVKPHDVVEDGITYHVDQKVVDKAKEFVGFSGNETIKNADTLTFKPKRGRPAKKK